jgi:hypothetical protein
MSIGAHQLGTCTLHLYNWYTIYVKTWFAKKDCDIHFQYGTNANWFLEGSGGASGESLIATVASQRVAGWKVRDPHHLTG